MSDWKTTGVTSLPRGWRIFWQEPDASVHARPCPALLLRDNSYDGETRVEFAVVDGDLLVPAGAYMKDFTDGVRIIGAFGPGEEPAPADLCTVEDLARLASIRARYPQAGDQS